jgi:WD40 repeat protein
MSARYLLILFILVCGCVSLLSLSSEPMLMINTEMHTSLIKSISLDAAEKLLLTCSQDKTARLWDVESGKLLRVLRPPIESGNPGVLLGCALTPDGRFAVVGGLTLGYYIYLFDTTSGDMVRQIGPLPGATYDLEFSQDGSYLAVGLGAVTDSDKNGLIVFRNADWQEVVRFEDYGEPALNVGFDTKGRLAVACIDGILRIYDAGFHLLKEKTFPEHEALYSVAFSPDGSKLAVGFYKSTHLLVLRADDLATLYEPDVAELAGTDMVFNTVCFSRDGKLLIAGGTVRGHDEDENEFSIIRMWKDEGSGTPEDFQGGENNIVDIRPLLDGGLVFGGTLPEWGRLDAAGNILILKRPETNNYLNIDRTTFRVSEAGDEIGFSPLHSQPQTFDLKKRSLVFAQSQASSYTDSIPGIKITDWDTSEAPKLNGKPMSFLPSFEISTCVDISAQNRMILVGGRNKLYCLDDQGSLIWKTSTQSTVLGVKITGDGKTALAVLPDGTIRWYRLSDGALLLSLFILSEGQRWILWTPSGYYDCSPGSESLIGWHVNQEADKEALFYPVGRFRSTYYRPDVIDRILTTLDEADAVQEANLAAGITDAAKGVENILPPMVRITSPAGNSAFTSSEITISYSFTSPNNEPVTGIKVLVDGRPNGSWKFERATSESVIFYGTPEDMDTTVVISDIQVNETSGGIKVTLPPRNVRVGIIAENRFGSSEPDEINLVWKGEILKSLDFEQPNLYALIIGISQYKTEGYKLKYPAKDARDFAASLQAQQGMMYDSVNTRLLTDDDATRDAILDGLDWLQKSCTAEDVAVIFLSGHGVNDNVGLFYYLPVGANITRLKATCIPFSDFENTIGSIPGKVIVFADACHSGGIYTDASVKAPDLTRMINEITDAEVGAIIFTSCTPRQLSFENDVWKNGAFTKALVEGLGGEADFRHKKRITVKALDLYVSDRVRELTEEKQTPTTIVPQSIPDFDIGLVP